MTLSDKKVQHMLRRRFVCGRENVEGESVAGASFAHQPGDPAAPILRGNGEHNIQILMATPDGRLLNVVAGYLGPKDFLDELTFALELNEKVARSNRPAPIVTRAHEAALDDIDDQDFGDDVFANFKRSRLKTDHRYAAKNPLEPIADFDATRLVGHGRSFFGSSVNGTPGRTIGDPSNIGSLEELKDRLDGFPKGERKRRPTSRPTSRPSRSRD